MAPSPYPSTHYRLNCSIFPLNIAFNTIQLSLQVTILQHTTGDTATLSYYNYPSTFFRLQLSISIILQQTIGYITALSHYSYPLALQVIKQHYLITTLLPHTQGYTAALSHYNNLSTHYRGHYRIIPLKLLFNALQVTLQHYSINNILQHIVG